MDPISALISAGITGVTGLTSGLMGQAAQKEIERQKREAEAYNQAFQAQLAGVQNQATMEQNALARLMQQYGGIGR